MYDLFYEAFALNLTFALVGYYFVMLNTGNMYLIFMLTLNYSGVVSYLGNRLFLI
jgi:hypothetical protein